MHGDYVPLSDVSEQTAVSVRTLREWCATGRLSCERVGGSWVLGAAEVQRVRELAAREVHPTRHASLALPAEKATPRAEREIAEALGVAQELIAVAPLMIDGMEYVVFAAHAEALGVAQELIAVAPLMIDGMEYVVFAAHADARAIEAARGVVERYGGQLLDP